MPDDPRLHDAFVRAGELGLPVLIHTADPLAFFQPLDENNERIEELAKHPDWWFGGPGLPGFDELLGSMAHVIESCPGTQFVGAHVGGAAEDLGLVARLLDRLPNLSVDLGGRMAELGRQPRAAAKLITQYPDRVLFGTDAFPVGPEDYRHWYRFLETDDECFDYAPEAETPPQGRWQVSALNLPADVLPKLYSGNANRLLRTPAH
jgi:predicted TIM-barrel fold metal-dependent hydrolase